MAGLASRRLETWIGSAFVRIDVRFERVGPPLFALMRVCLTKTRGGADAWAARRCDHERNAHFGGGMIVFRHTLGVTLVKALNARQKSLVEPKPHSSAIVSSFNRVSVMR